MTLGGLVKFLRDAYPEESFAKKFYSKNPRIIFYRQGIRSANIYEMLCVAKSSDQHFLGVARNGTKPVYMTCILLQGIYMN